jgi:hypothetical protein
LGYAALARSRNGRPGCTCSAVAIL